ncbi:MAG: Ldh family oxidoreductase [Planctomycetes bacterium]|nr:Ldh family oxidoreductase [Planctomycetota bacterium]
MEQWVLISADELRRYAAALLQTAGALEHEAAVTAESLVLANLCGHESHGVIRVPEYTGLMRKGQLVPGAELSVVAETPALLAGDANRGFGHMQCRRLIERLIPKARAVGVACGTVRNCGHVGRLGEWVERAAREGLAAMMSVNDNGVLKCVAPPGGTQPRISTNPIAIGVPTGGEPLVLDISTSAVANGKVHVTRTAGRECPPGWLLDSEGRPTTDPNVRFADPPGSILPMGGEQGYKGFGLGLLLDVLVGGLSGGWCPPAPEGAIGTNNVLLVLWDPERHAGRRHFESEAAKLIEYVRDVRRRPGVEAIRLPGDRSAALRREREREGIPLDEGTWAKLGRLAERLGVNVPEARQSQSEAHGLQPVGFNRAKAIAERLPLFVFGSLRRGQWNHDLLVGRYELMLPARLRDFERVRPLMIRPAPGGTVDGELYVLRPEQYDDTLRGCDALEGIPPGETSGPEYRRIPVTVETPDGPREAWAYVEPVE